MVLDASGSMLATDERPTRFDEAVRRARTMLADPLRPTWLPSSAQPRPRVVANAVDSLAAQAALGEIEGGGGTSAMREALFVASGLVPARAIGRPRSWCLPTAPLSIRGTTALGVSTRFDMVGRENANRAVTGLSVAQQPGGPGTQVPSRASPTTPTTERASA